MSAVTCAQKPEQGDVVQHKAGELIVPDLEADPTARAFAAVDRYLSALGMGQEPVGDLEGEFVENVLRFSVRFGVSAEAWLEAGAAASTLRRAGFVVDD